uniref:Uncharacterized protein n=1 Tax=Arundo donax TaxID=35708 RepID=A0A0A8YXN2_ARUDO
MATSRAARIRGPPPGSRRPPPHFSPERHADADESLMPLLLPRQRQGDGAEGAGG